MADSLSVTASLGSIYIGIVIASALWGVACLQTFIYFMRYQNDSRFTKWLVILVMFFDTLHQGLIMQAGYQFLVANTGQSGSPLRLVPMSLFQVAISAITAALVQGFMARKIWILSRHNSIIVSCITVLIIAGLGVSIAYTALTLTVTFMSEIEKYKYVSMSINIVGAATDILITATLSLLLLLVKPGTKRTDSVVEKLILYTVNTGLCTCICAVASLVAILVAPRALVYGAFYFCLSRIYSNSMLATLNARKTLQQNLVDSPTTRRVHDMTSLSVMFPSDDSTQSMATGTSATTQDELNIIKLDPGRKHSLDMALSHTG